MRRALWRTGVKIIWEHRDHGYSEKYLDAPDETELELLAPYQWTENPYRFAVLITTMDPGTPDLVGSALGLDGKAPLQRARFGAVVYLKNVIDSYLLRVRLQR